MPVVSTTASRTDLRTRPSTEVAFGARGDAVSALQQNLSRAGFGTAVDGEFGKETLKQLKAFQAAQGLPVTARVDTATAAALAGAASPTTPTASSAAAAPASRPQASAQTVTDARRRAMTSPAGIALATGANAAPTTDAVRAGTAKLKLGMQGPAVQELQERLNQDGAGLVADGQFGPRTEAAVKQWQASRDITDTGVVGPATQKALDDQQPVSRSTEPAPSAGADSTGPARASDIAATRGMSEAQKFDYFEGLAQHNGGQVKTGANQKNIVGLRTPTDADTNGGGGRYDDTFVMFWKDAQGNKRVREYSGNTEPSARYRGKMGVDVNNDGRLDQGRLATGFYEFTTGYSNKLGRTLNPVRDYQVERDVNQDGVFGNDGGRMSGGGQTMLFHAGGSSITGSAGCQTMSPEEYGRFWRDVNSGGTNGSIGYTLIEVG
jgi:peptidoglycan hydrolase-like protein with peptidoglycan-binding domain